MQMNFPDISNNPVGDNGVVYHNASIGLNVILNYMRETARNINAPQWDLYLINIYTMVRNLYQKGMHQVELEQMIDRDADILMTYIHSYTCTRRSIPATVFFYAPDYSAVPKSMLRLHTGNQEELDRLYLNLYKKLPVKLTELTEVADTRKFLCQVGKSIFPHKDIIEKLKLIYQPHRLTGSIGTVMISHCPLDFHIYKAIPKIQLFESYTGTILNVQDFGQKLIKDVKIPFNTVTHRLFGDSLQLVPFFKNKDRKTLIELARDKDWGVKTETEIIRDVVFKFDTVSSSDLTILRL